ncbi:MAG: hypothetical protein XD74_2153, partial [Actinobacteria bacterium 66_15]
MWNASPWKHLRKAQHRSAPGLWRRSSVPTGFLSAWPRRDVSSGISIARDTRRDAAIEEGCSHRPGRHPPVGYHRPIYEAIAAKDPTAASGNAHPHRRHHRGCGVLLSGTSPSLRTDNAGQGSPTAVHDPPTRAAGSVPFKEAKRQNAPRQGMPVLGICRGFQMIVEVLGGRLSPMVLSSAASPMMASSSSSNRRRPVSSGVSS